MNRTNGFLAFVFVLVVMGSGLYWWREIQLNRPDILIPVQTVAAQAEEREPYVPPTETLRQFYVLLEDRGIPVSESAPYDQLPYKLLDQYIRTALAYPEDYFSENFERTSSLVAAAWLRKQRLVISPRQAWANCLKLRWLMLRIDEITTSCQRISRWAVVLFPESTTPYLAKTVKIDQPTKGLVRSQRAYLRNPFDPSRLENLSLALARVGKTRIARELSEEMLQFDVDRASQLEQDLVRIEGYSHPWSKFEFQ